MMHIQAIKHSNVQEVKAFSHMHHSHLRGSAMKTRHFRNGTELKPLAYEPDYDFNFQEFRSFPEEIPIRPVSILQDSFKKGPYFSLSHFFK
ncbi:hypothetical protein DPMN_047132 [Dreissena polymorpha]|uniref:Copper type II ascorbate-dependent monooxygenase C-terminal domain-containing protein n=1 Tax=Dreissena polymorpha TaxID=45954 RepID=A0A9D4I2U9_DREPO|nr:hypothetical protein DPMN_047132 [Dreissena polymorpha]